MAELNFGLLTPPGSQSIGNAFVTGMDQAAVARAQENQNALSQYTLAKAKREDQLTNQMLAGMQGATTIEQQAAVLRSVGRVKEANDLITSGLERDIKKGTLAAQPGLMARTAAQTDAAIAAKARSRQEFEGQALRDLGVNPSDDNIRALGQDAVLKGIYTQPEADQKVSQFLAIPLADRAANFSRYGAPATAPQQPRQPNLAADLLIPGPNGTMVPNQPLIGVKTGLATAARSPGATVVMPTLEKAESQEKGKLNVKVYGDIAATADRARKILPALETSETILNGGFKTGFGADVQTQAARVLSVLGVPEADKYATNSQLFLAQGRQALLQRQLEQKGAQSEGDAQRINQTFIQLGNTPEANKFLVATAKAQSKQDIARQKFYSDWWSKSKTYEGAEEAWLDGAGGKSLFDSPDMKQFAPKTQPSDISSAAAAEIARRKGTQR